MIAWWKKDAQVRKGIVIMLVCMYKLLIVNHASL